MFLSEKKIKVNAIVEKLISCMLMPEQSFKLISFKIENIKNVFDKPFGIFIFHLICKKNILIWLLKSNRLGKNLNV